MQQVPFFHNIRNPSSHPDIVNIINIWSPLSQVRKLFGIYHLLGLIRGPPDYNLYTVGYVQQVPFFHNIHHPNQKFWLIFLSKFFNSRNSRASVPLRNVWSTILKEWVWYRIFGSILPWLFSVKHLILLC